MHVVHDREAHFAVTPDALRGRRSDVLATLKSAAAPMTIAQLAADLAVHPNTVRFHLDTLLAEGRVERVEPDHRRPGRPPLLFRPVRRMNPGGPRRYRMLAEILTVGLAGDPDASSKALDAGRAWGRRLGSETKTAHGPAEPVHQLVGLLDELGFEPERNHVVGAGQVGLRHCPFLELAENRSAVVCPIHLGLMQGALQSWNAPVTVDRLEPFAEPDLCLARLAPHEGSR